MPQIDVVAYLTQYIWTLISLLLLFSFVVLIILPRIQQQLALRAQAEVSSKEYTISVKGKAETGPIVIFKTILNLDYDN
uniref:ATP synthase F0 subunit 8 n=1 Tax=Cliona patera TaxID=2910015 RepID=A0A9E8Z2N9_9METZ|nr:ATP synthase F0 subunit 8 [Cliona patera]WAK85273.1 ATP synthase F0 subunit 8 [Cliona patera]WAK85287.1 ATP synthase F0 subunit 8 [Cliona patera]WAK85301.1 ATP synthase F0 subunit 8 [Cliona patera]WAK85315.1 ATP synthase F0 subunit 8 [Cliona patera]WAK85329.1 ATP synthase F0 subunit 8 [Cliona patera]